MGFLAFSGVVSASLLATVLTAQKASAAVLIQFTESGGNVTATLSGSVNVTGLTPSANFWTATVIRPNVGLVSYDQVGGGGFPTDQYANLLDNPNDLIYGTESLTFISNLSGSSSFALDPLGTYSGGGSNVFLPSGYAGGALNASLTIDGSTLASLGIIPGTYSSGFNSGADTITIQTTPIPEPLTLLGATAAMGFGAAFKRRSGKAEQK
jgi:hypothetical protein